MNPWCGVRVGGLKDPELGTNEGLDFLFALEF
jgi:hypothetical protein